MSHLTALLLSLAGFGGLALATDRQQQIILQRPLPSTAKLAMRVAAACSLALALAVLAAGRGWGLGLVMFSGHTSLAVGLVYCALLAYGRFRS